MQKRSLGIGTLLTITFLGTLIIMIMPIWDGSNFFKYADEIFNSLSKGSVYFIPEITKKIEKYDENINIKIKLEDTNIVNGISLLYSKTAKVKVSGNEITISGNLKDILKSALLDADLAYHEKYDDLTSKYGLDGKEALYYWWISLKEIAKHYKRDGKLDVASFIDDEVITKAIEPAYNFYGLKAESVKERAPLVVGLLSFYVIYTIWWGFAIFFLFEGFGLRIEKAKDRREI